ncbi:TetR/AcrR family transcriptional regulator C-terminal ligand-binding domain-containing protein [Kribbella sp. CA-253562]|uniref:TetR-like C-terminal domain-containing protein n=1 Tax=Kribbella sp. CA-253562 TaxID=3239942 RepID=UPI003D8F0EB0
MLQAAGELLIEAGMAGFTIEKVAARAGASRVTLHKWWPSRGALALDGYSFVVRPVLDFRDTGDFEADLTDQVISFVGLLRDTSAGRAVAGLIGAAQTDPELAKAFSERYSGPRRAIAAGILTRAAERDQISRDVDPEVVIDQIWGACYNRLLVGDQPLTDDFARALVHNILHGVSRGR